MFNTAGQYEPFYDMCLYCDMDTGGQHKPSCPNFLPQLVEKGLKDIEEGRYKPLTELRIKWEGSRNSEGEYGQKHPMLVLKDTLVDKMPDSWKI